MIRKSAFRLCLKNSHFTYTFALNLNWDMGRDSCISLFMLMFYFRSGTQLIPAAFFLAASRCARSQSDGRDMELRYHRNVVYSVLPLRLRTGKDGSCVFIIAVCGRSMEERRLD